MSRSQFSSSTGARQIAYRTSQLSGVASFQQESFSMPPVARGPQDQMDSKENTISSKLGHAIECLPKQVFHAATTPMQQLGKLYLNLSAFLGQQQLSSLELQHLVEIFLTRASSRLLQQLSAESTTTEDQHQQPSQTATVAANTEPDLLLPWHTLVLSNQPLGSDGVHRLFHILQNTKCLRCLVLADSNIQGTFTGDVLHVLKSSNSFILPQWLSRLQWLDLSHNPQLQLLGGDELDVLHLADFLDVCQQLQGLCLQHTGMSAYQLGRLMDLMHILLTEDDCNECYHLGDKRRPSLSMLQCLKIGSIAQFQDNDNAAAAATEADPQGDSSSGWPDAAFQDVISRLRMHSPPMDQLVVLEFYGLSERQQQQLQLHVAEVCSMLAQHPERHQQVMQNPLAEKQPHLQASKPGCCRLSWLKPDAILEFEQSVDGLEWEMPPAVPLKPIQAPKGTADVVVQQPAAPFSMPAAAHGQAAAAAPHTPAAGWTTQAGHTRQPQQEQQHPQHQQKTERQQAAATPGRPRMATPHHTPLRQGNSLKAAAGTGTVRQPSGTKRQQQQQQQGSRHKIKPAVHQRTDGQQPWITDYTVPQTVLAPHLDILNKVADDEDDDFVMHNSRQQWRQKQQRMPRAATRPVDMDEGLYLGSQDSDPAAPDDGEESDGNAPGLLAKLFQTYDSLYTDGDRSESAPPSHNQDDPLTGHASKHMHSSGREQQQPQRLRVAKRKRRHTLQAIPLGDDYAGPRGAAAASRQPQQGLPPLESPLSPVAAMRDSWQLSASPRDHSAATDDDGGHSDSDDDQDDDGATDEQQASEEDLDLFLASDNDEDLEHGMYSQERVRRHSSQLTDHDDTDQGDGDDDDEGVEGLRAFPQERRSNLPGREYGKNGNVLFGTVKDGAKRRRKILNQETQEALHKLAHRRNSSVDEQIEGTHHQWQQQQQLHDMSDAPVVDDDAEPVTRHKKHQAAKTAEIRRKAPQHAVHRFLDVAAAGGASPVHRRRVVFDSNDEDDGGDIDKGVEADGDRHGGSSDDSDSAPHDGRGEGQRGLLRSGRSPKVVSNTLRNSTAAPPAAADNEALYQQPPAVGQLSRRERHDGAVNEPVALTIAAAAAGGGGGRRVKRRSLVAVMESESQKELDQLHQQGQQQRQRLRHMEQQQPAEGAPSLATAFNDAWTESAWPGDITTVRPPGAGVAIHEQAQQPERQQLLRHTSAQQPQQHRVSSMQRPGATTSQLPAADPGTPATPPAAAATAADGDDAATGCQDTADQSDHADDESSDDIDDLPAMRELREAEARLQRLQQEENRLQQRLEAALAAAANHAVADATVTPAAAEDHQAPVPDTAAHQPAAAAAAAAAADGAGVDALDAAASVAPHDSGTGGAPTEAPHSSAAVSAALDGLTLSHDTELLAQQLREARCERRKAYRLVRELRNSVPFNWDKRGVEARSLRQMNQPQASKRQSRVPERLSPGAIEQQGRLLRQTRQKQQQGEAVFAVLLPSAAGAKQTSGVSGTRRANHCTGRGRQQDDSGSRSSGNESSSSDDDDDQPIAVLLRRARASTAAAETQGSSPVHNAGAQTQPHNNHDMNTAAADVAANPAAAAAARRSVDQRAVYVADGAAAVAPALACSEHNAEAMPGVLLREEGMLPGNTAAQMQNSEDADVAAVSARPQVSVAAAAARLAQLAAFGAGQRPHRSAAEAAHDSTSSVATTAEQQGQTANAAAGQAASVRSLVDTEQASVAAQGAQSLFADALRSPWLEAADVGMAAIRGNPAVTAIRQVSVGPPRDDSSAHPQQQQQQQHVVGDVVADAAPPVDADMQHSAGQAAAGDTVAHPSAVALVSHCVQQQQVSDLHDVTAQDTVEPPQAASEHAVGETASAAATAPSPLHPTTEVAPITYLVPEGNECEATGRVAAAGPQVVQGEASTAVTVPTRRASGSPGHAAFQTSEELNLGGDAAAQSLQAGVAAATSALAVAAPWNAAAVTTGALRGMSQPLDNTPPAVAEAAIVTAAQGPQSAVAVPVSQAPASGAAPAFGVQPTAAAQAPTIALQIHGHEMAVCDDVELEIPDSEEE